MAQQTARRSRMVAAWALNDGDRILVGGNDVTVVLVQTIDARQRRIIGRTGIDDTIVIECSAGLRFRTV